jgi:hypothetical protein
MWTEGVRIISNECTGKEGLEQDAVTFTVVLKVSGVGVAALEVARQLCEQTIQKAVRQMPMWEHKWIAQRTFSWISEM